MKKKLGLLLATVAAVSLICTTTVFASSSPLEKYNLYDDVMGGGGSGNQDRERATEDFYNNSMRPGTGKGNGNPNSAQQQTEDEEKAEMARKSQSIQAVLDSVNTNEMVGPRNKALRESSRNVYSDITTPDPWKKDISFYAKPSLAGIRANYKKSNFAGALQESISLVNHKNFNMLTREQRTMAYYYLAMCYTKCGQPDNAIRAYEKVISLHDSPMIVKYATNGRNCVMKTANPPSGDNKNKKNTAAADNDVDICVANVNVPELVYPNEHIADNISPEDLVPIDPNTLISKNMKKLQTNIVPSISETDAKGTSKNEKPLNLPFGTQDAELDQFINAPYGNGLSPEFNEEYKQIQLRTIQKKMNAETGSAMPIEETPESVQNTEQEKINNLGGSFSKFFQPDENEEAEP